MRLISLGLSGQIEEVCAKIQHACSVFQREGFRVVVETTPLGGYTFINCSILEGELSYRSYERIKGLLKLYAAQILADVVINKEETVILRRMIRYGYDYFLPEEQEEILNKTLELLDANNQPATEYSLPLRRNRVLTKIQTYLDLHNELVLEGFIRFRLKDYQQILHRVVEKAVDDYMSDIEYQEFIRVLHYFVLEQKPRTGDVHVVIDSQGLIKVFNSAGEVLNETNGKLFAISVADELTSRDLLLSALISIVPCTIMFHFVKHKRYPQLVQIVEVVFSDRVIVCDGCGICRGEISLNDSSFKKMFSN